MYQFTTNTFLDSDIGFEEDEEDIYFDPGLAPPPVPPRVDEKPALPPPRIDEKPALPPPRIDEKPALLPPRSRNDLHTNSSSLSGREIVFVSVSYSDLFFRFELSQYNKKKHNLSNSDNP